MTTTTQKTDAYTTFTELMRSAAIDPKDGSMMVWRTRGGKLVIRRTTSGQVAVIRLRSRDGMACVLEIHATRQQAAARAFELAN